MDSYTVLVIHCRIYVLVRVGRSTSLHSLGEEMMLGLCAFRAWSLAIDFYLCWLFF